MSFVIALFLSFSIWSTEDPQQGRLQVYVFKGSQLPEKEQVFLKKSLKQKKTTKINVLKGFKEVFLPEGVYYISTHKKKNYEKVHIQKDRLSQVHFDLKKEDTLVKKHDQFYNSDPFLNDKKVWFKGQVLSSETEVLVQGVRVFLEGVLESVESNTKGEFKIQVPRKNKFKLTFIKKGLRSFKSSALNLKSKRVFKMQPAMGELEQVVVLAPQSKGSIESLLKERAQKDSVSVFIGKEQFSKSGDSNAGAALKRVSGLSLVEGRYVYVRGLGERYSSTYLNQIFLPSPDPSRRVVPLDLFPTSLIESVSIQKSYSADQPAQFSAGVVEMRTLSIPKKNYFKYTLSTSSSSEGLRGSVEGLVYKGGGSSDGWGQDDGTRALPAAIKKLRQSKTPIAYLDPNDWFGDGAGLTEEELAKLGTSFNSNYKTVREKLKPNFGGALEAGGRLKFGTQKVGALFKSTYTQRHDTDNILRNSYVLESEEKGLNLARFTKEFRTESRYNLGGVLALGLDILKSQKIDFTQVLTRSTTNQVSVLDIDTGDSVEDSFKTTRLDWEERELKSYQVTGQHNFLENYKGPKLDWFFSESRSGRYNPDRREYKYHGDGDFVTRAHGNERFFGDLKDQSKDMGVSFSAKFAPLSFWNSEFSAGLRRFEKRRKSEVQRFRFKRVKSIEGYSPTASLDEILSHDNISSGAFQLNDSTLPTDNYKAIEENKAYFVSLKNSFFFLDDKELSFKVGTRREDHNQSVWAFDVATDKDSVDRSTLDQKDRFVAYDFVFKWGPKIILRSGFSKTISRPDLQEFAPIVYLNNEENILEQGNPNLKPAYVDNYDLRLDYFFKKGEFVSVGAFKKDIKNPIETITIVSTEDIRTFENIPEALNEGLEFEFRKHIFSGLHLNGNYSVIKSEVQIDPEKAAASTSKKRPLQGQSPYLINLGLEWSSKKKNWNTALVYNVSGRRISEVGAFGQPDIYEEPFKQLDFTLRTKITPKLSLGFKARNLLNPDSLRTQDGLVVRKLKRGRWFSLGISASI